MAIEALKLLGKVDAQKKIRELLDLTAQDGRNRVEEAEEVARAAELPSPRKLFEAAVRLGSQPDHEAEAFFKNPVAQPIRVEPKVEVVKSKPKGIKWRQTAVGWEYLVDGETMWRRDFGAGPKLALPKPKPEEPKPEEQEQRLGVRSLRL
jgi:hypothetical protein